MTNVNPAEAPLRTHYLYMNMNRSIIRSIHAPRGALPPIVLLYVLLGTYSSR